MQDETRLSPISPELEAELLGLISDGHTIAAIKRLREATSLGLHDAMEWVANQSMSKQQEKGKPCPYCGQPLRTDQAQQCLKCGMDWHDPTNVVRRG